MPVILELNSAERKRLIDVMFRNQAKSREASATAVPGESKILRKRRKKLNDRRNYHARFPESPTSGHKHRAPGSMKK